jgi:deazaflavin-dependent oxidoreductase (nitroreductase family)
MERFPEDVLERLAEAREVDLETIGRRSRQPRPVTTWVVVDDRVPYLRSEFGDAGQWYRNALAEPRIVLVLDGRRLPVTATRVTDPARWRTVSHAFRAKYARSSAVGDMVDPAVEPMTLALSSSPKSVAE